jgi:hypothetical protein
MGPSNSLVENLSITIYNILQDVINRYASVKQLRTVMKIFEIVDNS